MKTILIYATIFLALIRFNPHTNSDLSGKWTIDLRPTPDADGYYQTFEITDVDDKTFKGTFYGSSIENAQLNRNWEKLFFAFTTKDSSNTYYHSGYMLNGKIYGISYCPNRELTAPWTGVKQKN